MSEGDELSMLCRYFEEAEEIQRPARELAERDRRYYDNDQYTSAELAIFRKRRQAPVVDNHIKRKVEIQRGIERRGRRDPKAYPRNPRVDDRMADAATAALRYIKDKNDYDEIRSSVHENLIIEGYGGVDVIAKRKPNGQVEIVKKYVPWDRLGYDPHSRAPDFSDAKYRFIVIWRDAKRDDQDCYGATLRMSGSETYDDRPRHAWVDSARKRVRVVQMQYLHDGVWKMATFTKGGFTETGKPMVSPYLDEDGKPTYSLIMRSAYCDQENNRYGDVRSYISLQDEINQRRSKMLHLLSRRQTYGNKKAITDTTKAKQELAKPDGHVEINAGAVWGKDFGILPTNDMAMGQFELLRQTMGQMNSSGPNAALAGKAPGQQSGRALEAQIEGGSVEIEPLVDALRQFDKDVYRADWLRVRQFWTSETWVRVTDDERNVQFVGLNRRLSYEDALMQIAERKGADAAMQQAEAWGIAGPDDPKMREPSPVVENDVSGLDVDIVIEDGPSHATLQSEQFEVVSELARSGLPLANGKPVPLDSLIELSSLRNKDRWLKKWGGGEAKDPAVAELEKKVQELSAQNAELQQKANAKGGEIAVKAAGAQTNQYEAETQRMQVLAPAIPPDVISAIAQQVAQMVLGGMPQAAPQPPMVQ